MSHLRELNDTVLRGQPGEWSNYQLDIFRCGRCGMEHFVTVHNSGYRITRRITSCPPNRLRYSVTKTATKSVVAEWVSEPGPSELQAVTIDVELSCPIRRSGFPRRSCTGHVLAVEQGNRPRDATPAPQHYQPLNRLTAGQCFVTKSQQLATIRFPLGAREPFTDRFGGNRSH